MDIPVRVLQAKGPRAIEEYLIPEPLLVEAFHLVDWTQGFKEKLVYFAGRVRGKEAALQEALSVNQVGRAGFVEDTPETLGKLVELEDRRLELCAIGHSHPEWGCPIPSMIDWNTLKGFEAGYGPMLGLIFSIDARVRFYRTRPCRILIDQGDELKEVEGDGDCYRLPVRVRARTWEEIFRPFASDL